MADWGLSRALQGLYAPVNKRENANRELGVLAAMDQLKTQDAQQEQLAQMQQQAYYDKVDEFSNKLLSPDREKIQNKSRLLNQKIKEQLRNYGGSAKKFMEHGGFQMLRNYQNELMNSAEASTYMENKKNMDLLVAAQLNGKGHLINPSDMRRMDQYNKTGEGKVTYTGLMNEIEMPDSENYDWQTDIPAEDILKNEDNYVKIYGNYKLTHPDIADPTEEDLINFVKQNYRGKGSNWRRQAYLQEQQRKQAVEAAKLRAKTQTEADKNKYKHQYSGLVRNVFANTGADFNLSEYKEGYWQNKFNNPKLFNALTSGGRKYTDWGRDYALAEDGIVDANRDNLWPGLFGTNSDWGKGSWLENWFAEEFQPREAYSWYQGSEPRVVQAALDLDDEQIDRAGKIIKGWIPDDKSFTAAGVRVGDLADPLLTEKYQGDYRIKAIINGAYAKAGNGPHAGSEQMIMNIIDGSGKGHVNKDATAELDKMLGENAQLTNDLFVVLEDEDKNVFYHPLHVADGRMQSIMMEQLEEYDNMTPSVKNQEHIQSVESAADNAVDELIAPINEVYDQFEGREDLASSLVSELLHYSPSGSYDPARENLAKSFYTSMAVELGGAETEALQNVISQGAFTDFLQGAEAEGEQQFDYTQAMRGTKFGDMDIIAKIMDNDPNAEANQGFYNLWIQAYKTLLNR